MGRRTRERAELADLALAIVADEAPMDEALSIACGRWNEPPGFGGWLMLPKGRKLLIVHDNAEEAVPAADIAR